MKFLLAQPAVIRFKWELDVVLTNIRSLDRETPVVVLFTEGDPGVVQYIEDKYDNVEVHVYPDEREDKSYIPTVRPYLWYKFLSEDMSREKETYFQIDSDIIFRELPDFDKINIGEKECVGSDCEGYIGYDYLITRERGSDIVQGFADILNIDVSLIEQTPGIGAQWIISNPTAQLWWHIWKDCDNLYRFLSPLQSDIQKWTAEMWSQLYNTAKFGWGIRKHEELDFCRPTDDIKMWDIVKILHNAGVTDEKVQSLFFKGKYVNHEPFREDFGWVRSDKAGKKYIDAIKKVKIE